jgi:hypothetical protein
MAALALWYVVAKDRQLVLAAPAVSAQDLPSGGDGPAHRGTAIQPYRCVANPRKLFRKIMAAAIFAATARRRIIAAKKTGRAARKKRALVLPAVRLNAITCG